MGILQKPLLIQLGQVWKSTKTIIPSLVGLMCIMQQYTDLSKALHTAGLRGWLILNKPLHRRNREKAENCAFQPKFKTISAAQLQRCPHKPQTVNVPAAYGGVNIMLWAFSSEGMGQNILFSKENLGKLHPKLKHKATLCQSYNRPANVVHKPHQSSPNNMQQERATVNTVALKPKLKWVQHHHLLCWCVNQILLTQMFKVIK